MIDHLLNQMRLQALLAGGHKIHTALGTVISFNPADYTAKVNLLPDNIESGWLPILSPWVGNQWGFFAPPTVGNATTPGDLVLVHFIDGNVDVGVIGMRLYTNAEQPLPVNPGEAWMVQKSGSGFKFHNDGSVDVIGNTAINITSPTVKIGASGQTLQAFVLAAFQTLFNNHTHAGVQAGSGVTGITSTPMGASHLTTTITGG